VKIAVTCYESLGLPGGSALQVLRLAEGLAAAGHEVTVYAPDITRAAQTTARAEYLPVLNFPGLRFLSYLFVSLPYFSLRFLAARPDAVLAFEVYFDCSVLLAARLARTPLHAFINAIADQELRLDGPRRPLKWALQAVQGLLLRSSRGVYTISEEISAWLRSNCVVPAGFPVVLKNGVDTVLFSPMPQAEAAKAAGLPGGARYVGFVGRPAEWHGLEYLIDAAPGIIKSFPDVKFLIVGDGPALPAAREYSRAKGLEKNFIFTGSVPHAAVPAYIGACEICVVFFKPVRSYPGDPMKLYEYLACGRPVVASAVPGYGDLAEKAGAGVAVDAADPQELAAAVTKLLAAESDRVLMGLNGRKEALAHHSWASRAERLAACLSGDPR
jgi:glycosyltransferase involved in cell wall biosynthesis